MVLIDLELSQEQHRLVSLWRLLLKSSAENFILDFTYKTMSLPKIMPVVDYLVCVFQMEQESQVFSNPEDREAIREPMSHLVKKVSLELTDGEGHLSFYVLMMTVFLAKKLDCFVPESPNLPSQIERYTRDFDSETDINAKFFRALKVFILGSFMGNNIENDQAFFKKAVSLNLNHFKLDRVFMSAMIELLFSNPKETYQVFASAVFDPAFYLAGDLVTQKCSLIWATMIFPSVYGEEGSLAALRKVVRPKLHELYQAAMNDDRLETVFSIYNLLIDLEMPVAKSQQDFRRINQQVEEPLSQFIEKNAASFFERYSEKKVAWDEVKTIGFVIDNVLSHSPFKVLYALLKGLSQMNHGRRIILYDLNYMGRSDSDLTKLIQLLNVEYKNTPLLCRHPITTWYLYEDLCQSLHTQIMQDEVEVLVMSGNRVQCNALFSYRAAPVQVFLSYGNYVYDAPLIDYRLCLGWSEQEQREIEGFSFDIFQARIPKDQANPRLRGHQIQQIEQIRSSFPEEAFILGNIGRLAKIDNDEFMGLILEILMRHPQCHYVCAGDGLEEEVLRDRFRSIGATQDIQARISFPGRVNTHIYGHVFDAMINTFPFPQGLSLIEFMAKRKPVLSIQDDSWGEIMQIIPDDVRFPNRDILQKKVDQLIQDKDEYIRLADVCFEHTGRILDVRSGAETFLARLESMVNR